MISPLSFLQDNLKVIPLDNDLFEVTVILPEDFLHQYTQLINSLYGFFQFVQKQNKLSKAIKSRESGAIALQAKKNITEYHRKRPADDPLVKISILSTMATNDNGGSHDTHES